MKKLFIIYLIMLNYITVFGAFNFEDGLIHNLYDPVTYFMVDYLPEPDTNSTTVNVFNDFGQIETFNEGTVNIDGIKGSVVVTNNNSSFNLYKGQIRNVSIRDDSDLNMYGGEINWLLINENGRGIIYGGELKNININLDRNGQIIIYDANIADSSIYVYNQTGWDPYPCCCNLTLAVSSIFIDGWEYNYGTYYGFDLHSNDSYDSFNVIAEGINNTYNFNLILGKYDSISFIPISEIPVLDVVNFVDYAHFVNDFNTSFPNYDLDFSGIVDANDLIEFSEEHWLKPRFHRY